MAVADFDTVQKYYIAFYQRPADPAGLKFWADQYAAAAGDASAIINTFATSAEAESLYGPINDDTIGTVIDSIYQGLFGRAPDEAGRAYYEAAFAEGTFTAGTIALAIMEGAQGDDETAIANKLQVANEFTAQVDGREFDDAAFGTAPFNVTYTGDADAEAARGILEAVTADPATVLDADAVTAALRDQIADEGDPIGSETDELSAALVAYQEAVAAKSDFLEEAAEKEAVAAELEVDEPSEAEIEDAIEAAVDTAKAALNAASDETEFDYNFETASDDALPTMIADVKAALAENLQGAREDVAEVKGLQTAINALIAAEARLEIAVEATAEANIGLTGEVARASALNEGAVYTVAAGAPADGDFVTGPEGAIIVVGANGQLEATEGAEGIAGFATLLASAQTAYNARALEASRSEAVTTAEERVDTLDVDGTLTDAYLDADAAVRTFDEAVEQYGEVAELAATLEERTTAVEDAVDVIEALGYELAEELGTENNDLFVFTDEEMSIDLFAEVGDDLLFIGDNYELGQALNQGDNAALEIFFTQQGDDTVISIEETAFGSSAATPEVTEITLVGVNAAALQFQDGYVSVAA